MSPKNALSGASLALAAFLCAVPPAHAADKTVLRPMLDLEQGWDSNIFNRSGSTEGSLVTRVSPGFWIENTSEIGHARLGLTAVGRSVWRESELSGIDGNARGDFERMLTPRLSLFGNGLLEHFSGYEEIVEGGPVVGGPSGLPGEVILAEQPSWNRDGIEGGIRYLLTPRLVLRVAGSAGRLNYEAVDAGVTSEGQYRDRTFLGSRALLLYQLTALDKVELGIDLDDTEYQDLGAGTNDSEIWNARLGWTRNWSPFWSTTASIGVRGLDATQDNVPQTGGSQVGPVLLPSKNFSSSGTGLIGSLSIQRVFARSLVRLAYDRDTRSSGGSGRTNFDIDSFTLSLAHQLAQRVKLTLTGNYSIYHSATDKMPSYAATFSGGQPTCALGGVEDIVAYTSFLGFPVPVYQCFGGSSEEKREYTTLIGRVEWQMRRKLTSYVIARYYTAVTDQTLGNGREFQTEDLDKFTIGAGFRYYWDLGQ